MRCAEQKATIDRLKKDIGWLECKNKELHNNEGKLQAMYANQKDAINKHETEIDWLDHDNKEEYSTMK